MEERRGLKEDRADTVFIGILPAAGLGSRLRLLRCPKELLPVAFFCDPLTGAVRPMLAAEYSLYSMREAGVRKCLMVISDRKPEMLRYFGNGSSVGISIAYTNQPEPLGLASAIDTAFDWTANSYVCLALPDTIFSPRAAVATVNEALLAHNADLVLGVFPTLQPQQLGPVRIDNTNRVVEVLEKPQSTDLNNTWGIAAWTPSFSKFLHRPASELRNLSIGEIFNDAVREGFDVRAVSFDSGSYTDLGTGEALAAMIFSSGDENHDRQETLVSRVGCSRMG
jgi:glucose-1-phosphate thymidylyltransferase